MPIHIVKRNENLSTIAKRYGIKSWQEIYNHPTNASFRKKRPNPHVIQPGDQINIPIRNGKNESVGNLTVEVYEGNSVIKLKDASVKIIGQLKKPISFSKRTGPNGIAKFSDIPLGMYKVEVLKEQYEPETI